MLFRIVLLVLIVFIAEYYFYQSLKNILSQKFHYILWIAELLWILILLLITGILMFYRPHQWHDVFRIILSVIVIVQVSKLFGSVWMLLDDVRRMMFFLISKMGITISHTHKILTTSRSEFFSQLAAIFTFIPLTGFIYGIIKGAYKFKVHEVHLKFPHLPLSMNGFKIVQISDLHLGSFFSTAPVEKVVKIVNDEKADIIFFTGDLVNNIAEEALPFKNILSELKAPLGVYSILGNHDYGDYVQWNSIEEKQNNLKKLIQFQQSLGWDVLLNENRIIERNGESIAIIGVENWGGNLHFPKYGKLDKAYKGTENIPFKILLSHDPSHWDLEVSKHYPDIDITFSGHTHGFQFGVDTQVIKFSPVQWVYKHWAGLYKKQTKTLYAQTGFKKTNHNKTQYLYVNRGVGFIGYPGRLGIWPEITVITLHKE